MSDEYEVGHGKPPKHTQFKPGESGNPKGRPKGTKNLATDLSEELAEMIVVNEGGRQLDVPALTGPVSKLVYAACS